MFRDHSHPIWLQNIKADWSIKRVKHSTYLKARVGWHGLTSADYLNEGVILVTGTDFQNGRINWDTCYHVSEDRYQQDPYIQLREGDLLITKDGTIGKVALVEGLNELATLNSGIFVTRPLKDIYTNQFMYWLLQSNIFQSFIDYIKVGTTINHLYQNQLSAFAFPVPSLDIQKLISNFLDRKTAAIATLITKKQRLIQLLEEKRTALINQTVTKGLNSNAPMKDSGIPWIGEIPEHWEICSVKRLAQILRGKFTHRPRNDPKFYGGSYPFIQTGDISRSGRWITEYSQTLNQEGFAISKEFPMGTVVMVITGAKTGEVSILGFDACFPDSAIGFTPDLAKATSDFLYYMFSVLKPGLDSTVVSSTQENLNVDRVGSLSTICPPLKEQVEIVNFLDFQSVRFREILNRIDIQIKKLQEYRRSLITAAVTGKLDISEVDSNV